MKIFRDRTRREWQLEASGGALLRVLELTGLDLVEVIDPGSDLLPRLCLNPGLLAKMLSAWCQPQIESVGLSTEQFRALLVPGVQDDAREALLEELPDFFYRPQQALVAKLVARLRARLRTTEAEAMKLIQQSPDDPALDPPTCGTCFGPSAAGSTSTPDPSS